MLDGQQGDGHGQAFGDVLKPNAHRQGHPITDVTTGKPDANGHAFREVVQGNGDDEQPYPAYTCAVRAFPAQGEVFVG